MIIAAENSKLAASARVLLLAVPCLTTILFGGVDNATWVIITLLISALSIIYLFDRRSFSSNKVWLDQLNYPLVALILIGVIQLLPIFTADRYGLSTISFDPFNTRLFTCRLVIFLIFFGAAKAYLNDLTSLKRMAVSIVIFGSIAAFYGILQYLSDTSWIYGIREVRLAIPFGPFINLHHFAAFMEMTFGLAIALVMDSQIRREWRLLASVAAILMAAAVLLTQSRGGLLSMFAVLLIVVALTARRLVRSGSSRKMILASSAAIIAVVIFASMYLSTGDLFSRISTTSPTGDVTNGRSHFWSIALKIFADHPILGTGLDAFGAVFPQYDTWNGTFRVEQAHNDYLQMLSDGGLVGFACVVVFIGIYIFRSLKNIGTATEKTGAIPFQIGAFAGCIGILIHSFVDFPLRTPSNAFFFLLLAAISISAVRPSHSQDGRRRRSKT